MIRTFRPGDEPAILAVADAALPVDRPPGMTRLDMVHAVDRIAGDPEGTLVAVEDDTIVGYCTPRHDDLTVHPDHRRRGHGRRLVAAALDLERSRGLSHLVLYGPADKERAAGFIKALGFTYQSSMWMFELAPSVDVAAPAFPEDVVRTFRPESDLATFVELANASFDDHPTPLTFTEQAVKHVHAMPDFDPEGILFVSPRDEPDRPIAWTKSRARADRSRRPPWLHPVHRCAAGVAASRARSGATAVGHRVRPGRGRGDDRTERRGGE